MTGRLRKIPSKEIIEDSLYWKIRGYDCAEVTEELREFDAIDLSGTGGKVLHTKMVEVKIVHKAIHPDTTAIIFAATTLIPEKYNRNPQAEDEDSLDDPDEKR